MNENEKSISDYCASVIKYFETVILPFHFGLCALNTDYLINNNTTEIKTKLFNVSDNLFIIEASDSITDGTQGLVGKRGDTAMRELFFHSNKKFGKMIFFKHGGRC